MEIICITKQIELSTFERLQRFAKPLVDTPDIVVNRALDALEQREINHIEHEVLTENVRNINPRSLPDLKHTRVLAASLDRKSVHKPNWNLLVYEILSYAMNQLNDFSEVQKHCPVNMVLGCKEDEGYRYLAEIGISVQGLSANNACEALVIIANSLNVELNVTIMWRNKEGAVFPGEKGSLSISSTL